LTQAFCVPTQQAFVIRGSGSVSFVNSSTMPSMIELCGSMALFLLMCGVAVRAEHDSKADSQTNFSSVSVRSQSATTAASNRLASHNESLHVPEDLESNELWKSNGNFVDLVSKLQNSSHLLKASIQLDSRNKEELMLQLESTKMAVARAREEKANLAHQEHEIVKSIAAVSQHINEGMENFQMIASPSKSQASPSKPKTSS